MNPEILNAVEKLPLDKRGELFTAILQKMDGQRPKVEPMLKPIYNRAFQSPRRNKEFREVEFRSELDAFQDKYSHRLINEFFDYWIEGKIKLRFEKQKTFEVGKRLARWAKNDERWNKEEKKDFEDVDYGSF